MTWTWPTAQTVQVSRLSGGQQKRVSIGVELLTRPGLFFLDEPTSGLDPGTETALMHLLRRLADQGHTIILITHATKNVLLADKVVFMARGGYLAWFGPPEEALEYFDSYRSERDRRTGRIEFDEIYAILEDPSKGTSEDWAKRYQQHPAFQKYIAQPLREKIGSFQTKSPARPAERNPTGVFPVVYPQKVSSLRQFEYPVLPQPAHPDPRPPQPAPAPGWPRPDRPAGHSVCLLTRAQSFRPNDRAAPGRC